MTSSPSALFSKPHDLSQDVILDRSPYDSLLLQQDQNSTADAIPTLTNSQTMMTYKINELDNRLDNGYYRFYVIWLYIVVVTSILQLVPVVYFMFSRGVSVAFFTCLGCCGVIAGICAMEIKAIRDRSLPKAENAIKIMILYFVINFTAIALNAELYQWHNYQVGREPNWLQQADRVSRFWGYYCVLLALHLGVTLIGMIKVHKVLRRMQTLQIVFLGKNEV